MMFQAVVNEDATGSITALQAEIRRLREELEKARGDSANFLVQNKFRDHSRNFCNLSMGNSLGNRFPHPQFDC